MFRKIVDSCFAPLTSEAFQRQVSRRRIKISPQRCAFRIKVSWLPNQTQKAIVRNVFSRFDRSQQAIRKSEDCVSLVGIRSEEHTSELQSLAYLVCRLLLEKKKKKKNK